MTKNTQKHERTTQKIGKKHDRCAREESNTASDHEQKQDKIQQINVGNTVAHSTE